MSALPFAPLTITPRPTESLRTNSPAQGGGREGAGGWVPSVTNNTEASDQPNAHSPSRREGAGGRADSDSPAPLFSPDEPTTAAILDDFAAQDETLRDIADKYETTLESLTLWLARPDIAQRIHALESACATRARLVVANNLAAVANKLLHLLDEAKLDHESIHRIPATTHHAFAARMQSRESARKTANLLLRLARFTPLAWTAKPAPAPPLPAKRGEDRLATGQAGEGNSAHLNTHAVHSIIAAMKPIPTRKREAADAPVASPTPTQPHPRHPSTPNPLHTHSPTPGTPPPPVTLAASTSVQAPNHAAGP